MHVVNDQAIVIRRLDYSETSQVLVFLTRRHGLHRLLAKGVKRSTKTKFTPGIDLLERGDLSYRPCLRTEGGLGTVSEWRQTEPYLALRGEIRRWYAAQYAADITAAMCEEADPHPDVFDGLDALLAGLAGGNEALPLTAAFQCGLLQSVGLWPDLGRCVICDRPAPAGRGAYYAAHQGGLVCRRCLPTQAGTRLVAASVLTALREQRFDGPEARGVVELLDHAFVQAMGRTTSVRHVTG
ncbi:MAG: DNA repair protein RecO [Phycisphaerae bacterium]|nr:DNA repair protein RecO [Phycisphaerae bacterium]